MWNLGSGATRLRLNTGKSFQVLYLRLPMEFSGTYPRFASSLKTTTVEHCGTVSLWFCFSGADLPPYQRF